ncbi:MAG: hypothetical protein GY922_09250 [Proteobacteria bacterium]|nr:hypothetical protein [Pseudomonadota bacterium]
MKLDKAEILSPLRNLSYQSDIRADPNVHRHNQFRTGWALAVEGREYTDSTLGRLTFVFPWQVYSCW